jgi:hypothetical protein
MNDRPDLSSAVGVTPGTDIHTKAAPWISRDRLEPPQKEKRQDIGFWFLVFGVALPLFTLGFELWTHACGTEFFDPIPTWWHVALVATVPLTNFLIWKGVGKYDWRPSKSLMLLAGASLAISAIYGAMYCPMAPFACMGIIFMGFGFIPLSPIIAFFMALRAWWKMPATAELEKLWLPGAALGFAALAIPYSWNMLTYELLQRATIGPVEQRSQAVSWLRRVGHWNEVLTACYRDPRGPWQVFGGSNSFASLDQAEVQKVYYRLTGVPHNSQPAPASVSLTGRRGFGEWNFDSHIGGERVADKVAGLTMEGSRIDAKIDPIGLTSYTEWTLVFKNIAANQSEARAQIELPTGGVVSRLTLWINGQPQEAAFGGRGQVRAAYQEIAVVQRRDPVLVTTSGPDRVLMQCFPVPPNGGEMKVRLGITAPLRLTSRQAAAMEWPSLVETNFEPGSASRHAAWVESPKPLQDGSKSFRAEWNDEQLLRASPLQIPIGDQNSEVLADDPTDANFVIRQTIESRTTPKPSKLVVVIDGSRAMTNRVRSIQSALGSLIGDKDVLLFAGDSVKRCPSGMTLAEWINRLSFAGGCDNLSALEEAWDEAAAEPGGAILWIHGPQPVLLRSIEPLIQRIERSAHKPALYLAPAEPVPNRIVEGIADLAHSEQLAGAGDLESRLGLWRATVLAGEPLPFLHRERIERVNAQVNPAMADRHLARLWGREEVERMRATPASLDQAIKLALSLQLVTPVSGAVVLERKEQYDRHGLQQVDPNSVPTIPEPGSASLVAGALLWYGLRRRRPTHA